MQRGSWVQLALFGVGLLLFVGGLSISGEGLSEVDDLSALALGLAVVRTAAKLGGDLAGRMGQAERPRRDPRRRHPRQPAGPRVGARLRLGPPPRRPGAAGDAAPALRDRDRALGGGAVRGGRVAITATSVGITARVLKDLGASRGKEAKIILGAAVVDDVLALVVLALVTAWLSSLQTGEILPWSGLVALCMKTVGFLTLKWSARGT